jgi:hypothetical protein
MRVTLESQIPDNFYEVGDFVLNGLLGLNNPTLPPAEGRDSI